MVTLALLISLIALWAGYRISRSAVILWFGGFFVFSYFADLIVTSGRGALYFSPAYSMIYVDRSVFDLVALYAAGALIIYVLAFNLLVRLSWFRSGPGSGKGQTQVGWRYFTLVCAPLLALPAATSDVIGGYELSFLLSNRQIVYSESFAAHLLLYLAPPSCVLALVGIRMTRSALKRGILLAVGLLLVGLSAFSGSRSTLFLSVLLPVLFAYLLPRWQAARTGFARRITALAVVCVLGLAAAISASYLDYTRGEQDAESFLVAPDFGMLDATALIMDDDLSGTPSYFSVLTFFVPRSMWPDKPVSGNHVFSEQLFGERLEMTRTEMTASLLGEAYINLGWAGMFSAGVLMAFMAAITRKYLRADGLLLVLGLVLAFRGLNIVRGDLHNTVVPLAFTAVWIHLALASRRVRWNWGEDMAMTKVGWRTNGKA